MFKFFWNSGVLLAILMALLFSIDSVITVKVSKVMPIFQYSVASGVVKVAVTLVLNAISKQSLFGKLQDMHLLLPTGFFFGAFVTCLYGALSLLSLVDAVGLFYMNPVLSAILGWLAYKDPFGLPSMLGLACVLLGVGLLNGSSFLFLLKDVTWDASEIVGVVLGAGSAVFAALAFASTRGIGDRISAGTVSTWAFIAQILIGIPPMVIGYPGRLVLDPEVGLVVLTAIGALAACFGEVFACRSCQLIPVGLSTSIETTHLIWGLLWSVLFLKHSTTWKEGLGIVLIIAGAVSVGMEGPMKSVLAGWFQKINPWSSKQDPEKEASTQLPEERAPLLRKHVDP